MHISTASSMLCVTIKIDLIGMRPSTQRSSKSVRSVSAVSTSSAEKGSSIKQDRRVDDERAGKADALAHAAGQFFRKGGFEAVEADDVDRLQRARPRFGLRHFLGAQAKFHIGENRKPGKQRRALEHHGDGIVRPRYRLLAEKDFAVGRARKAGDDAQKRRLAASRSVRAGRRSRPRSGSSRHYREPARRPRPRRCDSSG